MRAQSWPNNYSFKLMRDIGQADKGSGKFRLIQRQVISLRVFSLWSALDQGVNSLPRSNLIRVLPALELLPLVWWRLPCYQSKGSDSNAGKMDQTWFRYAPAYVHSSIKSALLHCIYWPRLQGDPDEKIFNSFDGSFNASSISTTEQRFY